MSMQTPVQGNPTPKDQLRAMRIFSIAMIAGVSLFALIVSVLIQQFSEPLMAPSELQDSNIFLYAAAGLGLLGLLMAFKLYRKKLKEIQDSGAKLGEKMTAYQRMMIIFLALCEGPGIFSVIVLFLTSRYEILIITAVLVAAMLSKFPTRQKITELLQPDMDELQLLE